MPPKRKSTGTSKPAAKPRRSKLAKDNDISAETEREIQDAWIMCAEEEVDGFEDEKDGVVATSKIKTVMRALGIESKSQQDMDEYIDILDPGSDGYVTYQHFVELAAIQINNKSDETKDEEVETAYKLFTLGSERAITYQDLKRIAALLNQDVSDDVLKAMILEANKGNEVKTGVNLDQFRDILTRAGVFQ